MWANAMVGCCEIGALADCRVKRCQRPGDLLAGGRLLVLCGDFTDGCGGWCLCAFGQLACASRKCNGYGMFGILLVVSFCVSLFV